MKSALKGELEDVVLALLKTPAQYDAQLLKLAMKVRLYIWGGGVILIDF